MENRSLSVAAYLIALLLVAGSAWAGSEPSLEQTTDWDQRLQKASALQKAGKAQSAAADQAYAEKEKACFTKFRVNACRDEARLENGKLTTEARRIENEGKALERQVKKEQLSDKDARYVAEAEERAANLRARQAETSASRTQVLENQASARADKEKRAEEGIKRRALAAERHEKKQAQHAAQLAKKMEKAKRRAAEQAGK